MDSAAVAAIVTLDSDRQTSRVRDRDRMFIIHAGTHKTATSYIQSRLQNNLDRLASLGVHVGYPLSIDLKHKPLAAELEEREWLLWPRFLEAIPTQFPWALVSAEQFTQPLARPKIARRLQRLLHEHGFRLRIVVFLRDQADYINARFVHSIRRLYHGLDFEAYVELQLRDRRMVYDYEALFSRLLNCDGIETCFLPFRSGLGDPFERLMQCQGWSSPLPWRAADPSKGNIQPGCRGVWLAQEVARQLQRRNRDLSQLVNTSAAIRRIAEREGWTTDRYCGFDAALQQRVVLHYAAANERFAQRVWGQSWRDRFPPQPLLTRTYQLPASGPEREWMQQRVAQVMRRLTFEAYRRRLTLPVRSARSLLLRLWKGLTPSRSLG